ncbi:uncharacterized protein LOC119832851 [Zerene cesonia]|uniref:uncharacterized protein LOC119832851 n=1 Tax=Zerene cesonia TaxID=33412 RepID=UPI0018E52860|nr:uncharacterized protein LOC119832851 [Zerene cesonia]
MKSFVCVVLLAAVALAAPEGKRDKRGFLHGDLDLHSSSLHFGHGYDVLDVHSAPIIHSAPAARIVSVNKLVEVPKVVEVQKLVSVPKVVSVPKIVKVSKIVEEPHYSFSSPHYAVAAPHYSLGSSYSSGWW